MLITTRGIVFQTLPYSDSTVIAKIYTENFGLRSYLINAAHSKKSGTKARLLQPLSLIEISAYEKEKKTLNRVKEIRNELPLNSCLSRPEKMALIFFINDILRHSVKEEEKNPLLFEFLHSSIQVLELEERNVANFHISFLIQLSRYMGIFPSGNYSPFCRFFDLETGCFAPKQPAHPNFFNPECSELLFRFCQSGFRESPEIPLGGAQRQELVDGLITYYRIHLDPFGDIESHLILREVMK
jgi:DNA repair protein RecO (recombination protein O)